MDTSASDCGCWTDADGFWMLSDECRDLERRAWAHMMERARSGYYTELMAERSDIADGVRENVIAYFRQELGGKD